MLNTSNLIAPVQIFCQFFRMNDQVIDGLPHIKEVTPTSRAPQVARTRFQKKLKPAIFGKRVVTAEDVTQVLYTTGQVTIQSKDKKRGITIDAAALTRAYECVEELLTANSNNWSYSDLREFLQKFQRQRVLALSNLNNQCRKEDQLRYLTSLEKSVHSTQALYELLSLAPAGTDEEMALDLLFMTLEG